MKKDVILTEELTMNYITKPPHPIASIRQTNEWVMAAFRLDGDWRKPLVRCIEGALRFDATRVMSVAESDRRQLGEGERDHQLLKLWFDSKDAAERYLNRVLSLGAFTLGQDGRTPTERDRSPIVLNSEGPADV